MCIRDSSKARARARAHTHTHTSVRDEKNGVSDTSMTENKITHIKIQDLKRMGNHHVSKKVAQGLL